MKHLYHASLIILFLIFGLMLYAGYLLLYPFNPIDIKNPRRVINPEVKQGELLFFETEYCKYTSVPAEVSRQFVDGVIYYTEPYTSDVPIGCHTIAPSIQIPENLPPGEYSLRITTSYKVNPLRTIMRTGETENFLVLAK